MIDALLLLNLAKLVEKTIEQEEPDLERLKEGLKVIRSACAVDKFSDQHVQHIGLSVGKLLVDSNTSSGVFITDTETNATFRFEPSAGSVTLIFSNDIFARPLTVNGLSAFKLSKLSSSEELKDRLRFLERKVRLCSQN
jgi:hypothetical protein